MSSRQLLGAIVCLFCGAFAHAQTVISWAGLGSNVATPLNWLGGVAPTSANIMDFGLSVPGFQPTVSAAFSVGGVRFSALAGNFDLGGTSTLTIGSYGIDNQNTTTGQTISVATAFSGTTVTISNANQLTISGAVANGTSTGLILGGTGYSGLISGAISGAGNLIKNDSGVWSLSGANTFTGSVTVNNGLLVLTGTNASTAAVTIGASGTLQIGSGAFMTGGATGAIAATSFVNNGSLIFDRTGNISYGGISGTGSVSQSGSGVLTLTGTNTYSGATYIIAGTVTDAAAGAFSPNSSIHMFSGALNVTGNETIGGLGDLQITDTSTPPVATVTIASGKTLTLTNGSTFSGLITGAGALRIGNVAWETLVGTAAHTGGTTIDSGAVLQIGDGDTAGGISGPIVNNGTLKFNTTSAVTVGAVSGTGAVVIYNPSVVTLSGTNTYSGGTFMSGGTLTDAAANAFSPNSGIYLTSENANLTVAFNETVAGLGGADHSNGSTVGLTGNLTILGTSLTYNGAISGTGGIILSSGTQTFGGENTYSGNTTISSGAMLIAANGYGSATGTGNVVIASGAKLQLGNGSSGGIITGNISNAGTIFATGSASSVTGVISGAGSLSVNSGDLTLGAANTYTGSTFVTLGTLTIGATNALPTSNQLSLGFGSTLNAQNNQTIGRLIGTSGAANIIIGASKTLTIAPSSSSLNSYFGGAITGAGALSFAPTSGGSLTLNSFSTYSGGTTVAGGTLYVGTGTFSSGPSIIYGPVGTGALSLLAGSSLGVSPTRTSDVTLANPLTIGNNVGLGGGTYDNALILSGGLTVPTGNATIHLGDLVRVSNNVTSGATAGATSLTFDSQSGSFGTVIFTGTIAPSISTITASGAGVLFGTGATVPTSGLTLQASNGYVGIVSLDGINHPTAAEVLNLISNRSTFNGTFGFDTSPGYAPHEYEYNLNLTGFGANFTLGSLTSALLTGTITPAATGYAFGNGGGRLFVNSALTGAYGVTVSSLTSIPGNTLTTVFRGSNTYTGNLSVTNSLAVLDSTTALPTGSTVTLGANGYIGITESFAGGMTLTNFLSTRLASGGYTSSSVFGIDSSNFIVNSLAGDPFGYRFVNENIDLSGFNSVYLGTATDAHFYGTLTAPNQGGANRTLSLLAGDGALLSVESSLLAGNVNQVVLGSATAPFGGGIIALDALNTYTGGTTLLSGTAVVGTNSEMSGSTVVAGPLGTGTLTVASNAAKPALVAGGEQISLYNPISLGSSLQLGQQYFSEWFSSGMLVLNGVISDLGGNSGSLIIINDAALGRANTFTGGVTLQSGTLYLGDDAALGTGALTIQAGNSGESIRASLSAYNGSRTISNNVVFNSAYDEFSIWGQYGLTISGTFTLNNNLLLQTSATSPLYLTGRLTGTGKLNVTGDYSMGAGKIILAPTSGSNDATGGFSSNAGMLIFGNSNALPTSPSVALTATGSGYIGISYLPTNLQTQFLDRFDKASTNGTIGFDSPSVSSPLTYTGSIDLQGFPNDPQLGSASSAILSGTITPRGSGYFFGNGGGFLQVDSALVNDGRTEEITPRKVFVTSDDMTPLTVRLRGANTFSGGAEVYNSGLIYGATSLPSVGSIYVYRGYIGTENSAHGITPADFLGRFQPDSEEFIVGFDSFTSTPLAVTGNVSLTGFELSNPKIYLGTSTLATISGAIALQSGQTDYRFAGFKGGALTVETNLTDTTGPRGVIVGDAAIPATFGNPIDPNNTLSSVTLSGASTYSGGTTLAAGLLYLGSSSTLTTGPLGTGTLTVAATPFFDRNPGLFAAGAARSLNNAIVLNTGTILDIGGAYGLTLNGSISGTGELNKVGGGTLTLTGNNSAFSGDFYIAGGSVVFGAANSVGTGALEFGFAGGIVTFNTSATINGISGDSISNTINLTSGNTLTINQNFDAEYQGIFAGTTAGLIFTSEGSQLRLSGPSTVSGPTTVGSGITLIAANNTALGLASNAVTVNGGKLLTASGTTIANPITLTSGRIGGEGTFVVSTTGFDLHTGIKVTPGLDGVGTLTLDGSSLISGSVLVLGSGGAYYWDVNNVVAGSGGWDVISATGTVAITATNASPFLIKINSVGLDGSSALAANFNASQSYSWNLINATSITGFIGTSQFAIDSSGFLNPNTGTFSLSLNNTNTSLTLNFSPIPEPSTYVLMLAGLGIATAAMRRRRR